MRHGNPLELGPNSHGKPVTLSPEQRTTHLYCCGSTGTGKSKFLEPTRILQLLTFAGSCSPDASFGSENSCRVSGQKTGQNEGNTTSGLIACLSPAFFFPPTVEKTRAGILVTRAR